MNLSQTLDEGDGGTIRLVQFDERNDSDFLNTDSRASILPRDQSSTEQKRETRQRMESRTFQS